MRRSPDLPRAGTDTPVLVCVNRVFDHSVYQFGWRDSDELNRALLDAIAQAEAAEAWLSRSNLGGWHSDTDLFSRGGPFQQLERRFRRALRIAFRHEGSTAGAEPRWLACAWANVSHAGHSNSAHMHGDTTWTGVCYLSDAPPDAGGLLRFHSGPTPQGRDGVDAITTTPRAGLMLVFPGGLWHSVDMWHSSIPRVSVAFNAWLPGQTSFVVPRRSSC